MKIADVVNQARAILPEYTELFGDVLSIATIVASGGVATVTTSAAHNLSTGTAVNLSGVETRTAIATATKVGNVVTFTTSTDHDLTFGWPEHENITLFGFDDVNWNDTFKLGSLPNRRTFTVQSVLAAPTGALGVLLEPKRVDGINGVYSVTVTGSTTFTISGSFIDGTYTPVNGTVAGGVRMAGTIDIRAVLDKYTKQSVNDYWLFVEPVDADVSKDRSTYSDAVATRSRGQDMRTRILDGFNTYIIAPCTDALMAVPQLDVCRHDLLSAMMRTFYGVEFDTGLTLNNEFKTILVSHGVFAYEKAFLVYRYEFQVVSDLTDSDQVLPSDTRAFRNVDYTEQVGDDDITNLTVNVDLDDNPL